VGGSDGGTPIGGLISDSGGNLYGTASIGGSTGSGAVFELTSGTNGGWTETVLYSFSGRSDGGSPQAGLIFDSTGNLYGTTADGGNVNNNCESGCGVAFRLAPGKNGIWTESVLHAFGGGQDGFDPRGKLTFDTAGNLYGTTRAGGIHGFGTVFQLAPGADGWTETVLKSLKAKQGANPSAGVVFDPAGNLYATATTVGPRDGGTVFELVRGSNGNWSEKILANFTNPDGLPYSDLIFDSNGNLYGTLLHGGASRTGAIFQFVPEAHSWHERIMHSFDGDDGQYPYAGVVLDSSGNLYGTNSAGIGFQGAVYELSPTSHAPWSRHVLYRFKGMRDGGDPVAGLLLDKTGNLYGTTAAGGRRNKKVCNAGCGVVYEIKR
jgi:uncharacterized repeat protein (TIGR03803 family)